MGNQEGWELGDPRPWRCWSSLQAFTPEYPPSTAPGAITGHTIMGPRYLGSLGSGKVTAKCQGEHALAWDVRGKGILFAGTARAQPWRQRRRQPPPQHPVQTAPGTEIEPHSPLPCPAASPTPAHPESCTEAGVALAGHLSPPGFGRGAWKYDSETLTGEQEFCKWHHLCGWPRADGRPQAPPVPVGPCLHTCLHTCALISACGHSCVRPYIPLLPGKLPGAALVLGSWGAEGGRTGLASLALA